MAFQVHCPVALRPYSLFDLGQQHTYTGEAATLARLDELAEQCYLPANALMQQLLEAHQGKFRFALCISGSTLALMQAHRPDVLASFQKLLQTGYVELLAQSYHHSLCFLHSREEFRQQVQAHLQLCEQLFGKRPAFFLPAAGLYANPMGYLLGSMGFKGILAAATPAALKGQHLHQLFHPVHVPEVALLLADQGLAHTVESHFSDPAHPAFPLTAETFAHWAAQCQGGLLHLFWNYEMMGARHSADSGIFEFMQFVPEQILQHSRLSFQLPSDLTFEPGQARAFDQPYFALRDPAGARPLEHPFPLEALHKLYELEAPIKSTGEKDLLGQWRGLQQAQHFRQMDPAVAGPQQAAAAYSPFLNIIADLQLTLRP